MQGKFPHQYEILFKKATRTGSLSLLWKQEKGI